MRDTCLLRYPYRAALRAPATFPAAAMVGLTAAGSEHEHSKRTAYSCTEPGAGLSLQALPHTVPQRADAGTEAHSTYERRVAGELLQRLKLDQRSRIASNSSPARAHFTDQPCSRVLGRCWGVTAPHHGTMQMHLRCRCTPRAHLAHADRAGRSRCVRRDALDAPSTNSSSARRYSTMIRYRVACGTCSGDATPVRVEGQSGRRSVRQAARHSRALP